MASFYSDALLYRKPLISNHSTTITCPKIRLPRRGKKRLPVVRLGSYTKPKAQAQAQSEKQRLCRDVGRRQFSFSRVFRRIRLKWLRLTYSCMLKRLKQYYKSLIKDVIEGSASIEAYHQQRLTMEGMAMHPPAFSHHHGHVHGAAAPNSLLPQTT